MPETHSTLLAAEQGSDDLVLTEHVAEILRRGIRAKEDIIEIGRRLADAKERVRRGRWLKWLENNLGWTVKTAQRFISVYEFSQSEIFEYDKLSNLNLPISAIYLLAAPSTPEKACAEIIERARAGETPLIAEVQRTIDTAKGGKRAETAKIVGQRPRPKFAVVAGTDVDPAGSGEIEVPVPAETIAPTAPTDQSHHQDSIPAGADELARLQARVDELELQLAYSRQAQIRLEDALRLRDTNIIELENEIEELKAAAEPKLIPQAWAEASPLARGLFLDAIGPDSLLRAASNVKLLGELEHRLPAKFWNQYPSSWKGRISQALASPGPAKQRGRKTELTPNPVSENEVTTH